MIIKYSQIIENNSSFSTSIYSEIKFDSYSLLPSFFYRDMEEIDFGEEAESFNYLDESKTYFIRAGAISGGTKSSEKIETRLQLKPIFDSNTCLPLRTSIQKQNNLKKYDLIISKDSNVGATALLNKDLPNHMLCAALIRLPVNNPFYISAILKHKNYRPFIKKLFARGVSMNHGKDFYLRLEIPNVRRHVKKNIENLNKQIFDLENLIENQGIEISELIESHIIDNQHNKIKNFNSTFNTVKKRQSRLDACVYSKEFEEINALLKNYKNGFNYIDEKKIKGGRTPKKERIIKKNLSIGPLWVIYDYFDDLWHADLSVRIKSTSEDLSKTNNINEECILINNRTSRGKKGEYVGKAIRYDFGRYKEGHYHQGIYKIFNYSNIDLDVMFAFFNSDLIRRYCGKVSVGTKMKEIKIDHVIGIPIPKFTDEFKDLINKKLRSKNGILSNIYKLEDAREELEDFISNNINSL